ncbi:helix-turn-helix domain-containing protein [Roseiterribacter gracilis]|uniref:helix-turn-helix domain-containing protein n=1 Tax=Roseiterribacter gracilis TaxID=2812848 RepID=UPI003B439678
MSARPTLGGLLRGLRARHNWTLKEMSQRTGIPVSTLSKVEHDRLTLTYDKLLQLSEKLNLRMSELFAEPNEAAEQAVTARRSIGREDQAIRVNTPNYDYFYLCPELRHKRMIPALVQIRAKSLEEFGELVRHAGEEFVYVVEGRVRVHTEFYDPIELSRGESIYIDSNMGHAYVCADGCDQAVMLGVCSSAEEGLMESLLTMHGDEAAADTPITITDPTRGAPRRVAPRRLTEVAKRKKARG